MDYLPQEILRHIACHLDDRSLISDSLSKKAAPKLSPYAVLSRGWQLAVEPRTFSSIDLDSTELPYFAEIWKGHRRNSLSDLNYRIVLPTHSNEEHVERMDRDNRAFTHGIHALFALLKSWESEDIATKSPILNLTLFNVYSPMDGRDIGSIRNERDFYRSSFDEQSKIWKQRYKHSFLQLLEHPILPTLSCVCDFRLITKTRGIMPKSAVMLASKLSNVDLIWLDLDDNEKTDIHVRRQSRHDFALALPFLSGPHLRDFTVSFNHDDPIHRNHFPPSALLPSAPSTDHLSRTLHTFSLSSNLTFLRLGPMVISSDLYWPTDSSATPLWPHLGTFLVEFNRTAPEGTWYFIRDPADDVFDEDDASSVYRDFPSDPCINPLLLAMARAAAQMPKLEHMSLDSSLSDVDASFEINYYAPGIFSDWGPEDEDEESPRLYWAVGSWRPAENILKQWWKSKEAIQIRFLEYDNLKIAVNESWEPKD